MKLFLSVFLIAFLVGSFAKADSGYPSCYVEDGIAHAQLCSDSSASGSGTGRVVAFDRNGRQIFNDGIVIWIGIAIMGCSDAATVNVPAEAVSCSFMTQN